MELVKPSYRTRTITPFPEHPEFTVEVRDLNETETAKIFDKRGFHLEKNRTMERTLAILRDTAQKSLGRITGLTENGEDLNREDAIERLLTTPVEVEGEKLTLFAYIQKLAAEEREADEKNLLRV